MTFPTREDQGKVSARGYWTEEGTWIPAWKAVELRDQRAAASLLEHQKPRLDWLLLTVLAADLGLWVGLLAWWIWR